MAALNYFEYIRNCVVEILQDLIASGTLLNDQNFKHVLVEPPRDIAHGDLATNAALVLAKTSGLRPHELADQIIERLMKLEFVFTAEVAGPGFINIVLVENYWHERLADVLDAGESYGTATLGKKRLVNIEYVSANPTGPMHVGHGRGAVIGDVLANLFIKIGYDVTKEYYINDAGAQVDILARSLHIRYLEALGTEVGEIPEGLYPGEYLIEIAKKLVKKDGNKWQNKKESNWLNPLRLFVVDSMMGLIREDLTALGVDHDVFSSERKLVEGGGVDEIMAILRDQNLIYEGVLSPPKGRMPDDWEVRPQTLFRAMLFGDDSDRPIKKPDGSWTYFATDMAYHLDKFRRGFRVMINIWGADHGGYVKRMQAAVKAVTQSGGELDVQLCQMVNLMDNGEPVKMSKRAGTFVTLREVIDKVGKDVVRFIMLTRKNDAQLDFDLTKVLEQSRDNPVFYVQYSHARCCSVLRQATELFKAEEVSTEAIRNSDFSHLTDPAELALIKLIAAWPQTLKGAAEAHEPHRIAYYLQDLSATFHSLWAKGTRDNISLRFLSKGNLPLTLARLAMVKALATVIASGLRVMGIKPVQEMR
ncbi:MAG: arginine--tRNA ligase [Pseudomonadota bacterium]|nr:arginine--tRNA ligase [Pseudomonadota bacterium]